MSTATIPSAALLASPCECTRSLIFDDEWCAKCGHLLVIEARCGGYTDGWVALYAAVEQKRLSLLDDAEEDGIDVENDPDGYRAWLDARMAALGG
jgi:hypothetical protein